MATWLFDAGGLPQECVEIETDNPLSAGLLLAATPYSVFSTPPTRGFLGPVQGVRGGVLAGPPVRHGVANSTIVLLDLCVGQDGGGWWSAAEHAYRDTSAAWPNDLGLATVSTTAYGYMTVAARDSGGTVRYAGVDVVSGTLARGDVLFRAATIDSALLVRVFGNDGGYVGQSTAMQGFTYNAPTGSSGPGFGMSGANDTVTYQALALRFGRVVADAEIAALAKDLGQVFRRRRPVWAMAGAAGGSASTGTGSTTLDNLTLSATGSITAQGQASIALAGVTLSATGSITNRGAATPTLADVTLSATGASVNQGAASIALAGATLSATGSITAQGAASITLADLSLAATGESTPVGSGTASITLDDVSVAATGSLVSRGQATVTLEDLSLLASGSVTNRGEADITLADLSLSATGGEAVSTLDLILKILSNRQELDPTSGLFTIYDDDGSTVLYTAAAWEDAAGTIPYRGQALRRIDRLSI